MVFLHGFVGKGHSVKGVWEVNPSPHSTFLPVLILALGHALWSGKKCHFGRTVLLANVEGSRVVLVVRFMLMRSRKGDTFCFLTKGWLEDALVVRKPATMLFYFFSMHDKRFLVQRSFINHVDERRSEVD